MTRLNIVGDRLELLALRLENQVVLVRSDHVLIGWDCQHIEAVDLCELVGLGGGRASHARQLVVHAEVVLDRDGRDGDVLGLDLDALFGFDSLMQALAPASAFHDAARKLVDDLDLAVDHNVVNILLEERLCLQ